MALNNPVLGVYASEKRSITGKDEHWLLILRDKDAVSGRCYDYVRNPNNGRSGHGVVVKEHVRIDGTDIKLTEDLGKFWPGYVDHVHDLAFWAQHKGRNSSRRWVIGLVEELEKQRVIEGGHAAKLRKAYHKVQEDRRKQQRERWEKQQKARAERNGGKWGGEMPPMFVGAVPDPKDWRRSRPTSQVVNGISQPVVLVDHKGKPVTTGLPSMNHGRTGVPPSLVNHQRGVSRHDFGNGAHGHPVPPVVVDDSNVSVRSGRSRRSYQSTHSRRSEAELSPDHAKHRERKTTHTGHEPRAPSPARSTRSNRSTRTNHSTRSARSTRSKRPPSPARSTRSARSIKSTRSTRSTNGARSTPSNRAVNRKSGPPPRAFSFGNLSRSFSRMTMDPRASKGRKA